jgi:hypothetical protein
MNVVASVAGSVLAPVVGNVVGSIVGDIGKTLGGGPANPLNILGGIGDAFGALFGQQKAQPQSSCPALPLPFSLGPNFPINPFQALQGVLGSINQILPGLQGALGALGGAASFPGFNIGSAVGSAVSTPSAGTRTNFSGSFGTPDSLNAQAQDLLKPGPNGEPPSQANILKAQQLMAAADMIFKTISKLLEQQSEAAKTAISAIRA